MKIGLLGHGVVGSGVSSLIDQAESGDISRLEVKKILVKDESEMTDPRTTLDVNEMIQDPEIEIVAECMGGVEPAHTFVKRALESGKNVVTSNKKMLAVFFEELYGIAREKNVALAYEASVGGGIPWIADVNRIRRIETIDSFRGIFNGTTNYILSGMTKDDEEFDIVLKKAQELGYAERDPSDDIDGDDVRYKCAITAMTAFDTFVNPKDIPVFGIRHISKTDLNWAKENGCVCKLIGSGERKGEEIAVQVWPAFLKEEDLFSKISSNYNAIECISHSLGKAVFVGQGAGSLPTAHAVIQDMIDILNNDQKPSFEKKRPVLNHTGKKRRYYIRAKELSSFTELIDTKLSDTAFLSKPVALDNFVNAQEEILFLAEVVE